MPPTLEQLREAVTFVVSPLTALGGEDDPGPDPEHDPNGRFIVRLGFEEPEDAARFAEWAEDDECEDNVTGDGYHLFWPKGVTARGREVRVYVKTEYMADALAELHERWSHVERYDGVLLPRLERFDD